jgi:hypothetical protein
MESAMGLIHSSNLHGDLHGRWLAVMGGSSAPVDPLGAGNTALLAALAVTPILFHDVRSLGATGAIGSLPDVSGVSALYGGALTQGTGADQPTWNGTTLNFDGANDSLVSASLAALDISTSLSLALVADWSSLANFLYAASAGPSGSWGFLRDTGGNVRVDLVSGSTVNADTTVPVSVGMCLLLATINVAGSAKVTAEVPNQAKVTSTAATAPGSSSSALWIASKAGAGSFGALKYRASLLWSGGYSTAQRDTLKTYASTYHSAVLA